ncbi:MAG: insulinase family protein [Gammaproteobacteria bacterium]|nr:insulinase family protein [Gammaproteobacteria bacterium]
MKLRTTVLAVMLATSSSVMLNGCKTTSVAPQAAPESITINKSEIDKRSYAYKLLDNGLKVMVISDPDADKAAAALDVHIGHLADPKDREGLTHYLEHMLFLGSEKYPKVGEYGEFIKKHGGFNNAGTGQEHTNYFFQIDNDYLEPALDRFSRFFIDPLFDPEFVQKERNAVHSEYKLKVKDKWRRYNEAVKQTANQEHPFTQFSVGNLDTLSDSESSTILATVKEHYKKHYSAGIMSLVVVGNYPTEQLMQWAETKFSPVPNNGYQVDTKRPTPFLENQQGVKIEIKTLEDSRQLALQFAAPSQKQYYQQKPLAYLGHLVGYEGEGSLVQLLKQKGYIKSLGMGNYGPDDFTPMTVYIELTPKGYKNIDEIVSNFYSYIDLIKTEGIKKSTFDELAKIRKTAFKFQEKFDVAYLASFAAGNMQYYPPQNALDVGSVYKKFDKELIKRYLEQVTPEKMRMIVTAPDIESDTKEVRYDVPYSMKPLSEVNVKSWSNAPKLEALALPSANPYIASNLSLESDKSVTTPIKAFSEPGFNVWFENENEFGLPKSSLNLRLYSNKIGSNPQYRAAVTLHDKIIDDLLSAESYPAQVAGLYYSVSGFSRGYDINVQGYSEKSNQLLSKVVSTLNPDLITQDTFDRIKLNLIQEYKNKKFAWPIQQMYGALYEEVYETTLSDEVYISELEKLDLATLKTIVKDVLSETQAESLYIGNIDKDDVKSMVKTVKSSLNSKFKDGLKPEVKAIKLAENDQKVRDVVVDHNDSTIGYVIQADNDSVEQKAKYRMIAQMLGQRFYDSLRTKQQYGYIVSMRPFGFDETPGVAFGIQSPKAHPSVLKAKIDEFMEQQKDYVNNISAEEFEEHRKGLLSNLEKKLQNSYEKLAELKSDLVEDNYQFNSKQELIAAVKALTAEEMAKFYDSEIASKNKRSMVVWNIGKAHAKEASYKASAYNLCSESKCVINTSI